MEAIICTDPKVTVLYHYTGRTCQTLIFTHRDISFYPVLDLNISFTPLLHLRRLRFRQSHLPPISPFSQAILPSVLGFAREPAQTPRAAAARNIVREAAQGLIPSLSTSRVRHSQRGDGRVPGVDRGGRSSCSLCRRIRWPTRLER